ncbi:hypothetical protein MMC13_001415 [Lambiella insularis]|nr:hypothetical protein [Lambiella insularis]
MRLLVLLKVVLFVRSGSAAFEEIICHDNYLQRLRPHTRAAFENDSPGIRANLANDLTSLHASPQLIRLYATPQPLEHPITAAECLDAVSLIPESVPRLNPDKPGDPTRLNLEYTDAQRQSILRHRLDTGFVAGNCLVQLLRRPEPSAGLNFADASAMALSVFPNMRDKARAVIQQCLSSNEGQPISRFGYIGTRSVLNGINFYYVVSVTVWSGEQWQPLAHGPPFGYSGEQFYNREGEIPLVVVANRQDWSYSNSPSSPKFPFVNAFRL